MTVGFDNIAKTVVIDRMDVVDDVLNGKTNTTAEYIILDITCPMDAQHHQSLIVSFFVKIHELLCDFGRVRHKTCYVMKIKSRMTTKTRDQRMY